MCDHKRIIKIYVPHNNNGHSEIPHLNLIEDHYPTFFGLVANPEDPILEFNGSEVSLRVLLN